MSLDEADKLISSGFKHQSMFGRFCPVTWSRVTTGRLPPINPQPILRYSRIDPKWLEPQLGDEIAPPPEKKAKKAGILTCCAVYRECVYWFKSKAERDIFTENPVGVIREAGEKARTLRHQPLHVTVVGAPEAGKTEGEMCLVYLKKVITDL